MYAGNGDWVPSSYKSWVKALSYVIRKSLLQTAKQIETETWPTLAGVLPRGTTIGVNITNNQNS